MRRLLLLALIWSLSACKEGSSASALCQPSRREALDPGSVQHVLPGAPTPTYQTNPPTSGPHEPGAELNGVQPQPLTGPVQVGQLEGGKVILQYRDLSAAEVGQLDALGGTDVIVAPGRDLPDRVVATAWTFKQVCSGLDLRVLQAFARDHVGHGPGTP
jgi:Protein of unknown function (DUF3105)